MQNLDSVDACIFFSQQPIHSVDNLRQSKPWIWEGDPLMEQVYKGLGVQPIPLPITDVLLSLQWGMVNTVYASTQGPWLCNGLLK